MLGTALFARLVGVPLAPKDDPVAKGKSLAKRFENLPDACRTIRIDGGEVVDTPGIDRSVLANGRRSWSAEVSLPIGDREPIEGITAEPVATP